MRNKGRRIVIQCCRAHQGRTENPPDGKKYQCSQNQYNEKRQNIKGFFFSLSACHFSSHFSFPLSENLFFLRLKEYCRKNSNQDKEDHRISSCISQFVFLKCIKINNIGHKHGLFSWAAICKSQRRVDNLQVCDQGSQHVVKNNRGNAWNGNVPEALPCICTINFQMCIRDS